MEDRHQNEFGFGLATLSGLALSIWQSLPVLVKAYLLIATARAVLSSIVGFLGGKTLRQIMRENLTHLGVLIAILLIWAAGEVYTGEQSDIGQIIFFSCKLVSVWYTLHSILLMLDDLEALGVPIPAAVRERLRAILHSTRQNGGNSHADSNH